MTLTVSTPSFVGRTDELARMQALAGAARAGNGQAVLVEGESGIGKSRLVAELLAGAETAGMEVFRSGAEELDSHRPFGAIADCLGIFRSSRDPRRSDLARRLFGNLSDATAVPDQAGSEHESEFRLVEALVALVEDHCARGPVALAIDNLQWADTETLLVLHRLSRIVGDLPLLLLGTCLPSPRRATLARLRQSLMERGSPLIALGPLDSQAVAALVADVVGARPGPRLVRQAAAAAGNPFFVIELVAALSASDSIATESLTGGASQAEIGSVALPPALKLTILHRLGFLSAEVVDVLRMASVLGSSFSVRDLTVVVERSAMALTPIVRQAMDAGVLIEAGDRIAFRHDLIREALYEDFPVDLRMSLHRDLATTLAEAGAPTVQVAEHFVRGARPGDVAALEWLRRAADEVTVRAPGVASDLLKQALELFEPGDPTRDLVMADWVVSLEMAGRVRQAESVCLDLLSRPQDPRTEVRVRLALSRLCGSLGRPADAVEQTEAALAIGGLSQVQKARAEANASTLYLWLPDLARARTMAEAALAVGMVTGDVVTCGSASFTLSSIAHRQGRFHEALAWAERINVVGDGQPGERMAQGWQHLAQAAELARGWSLLRLDRLDEARRALTRARERTEQFGYRRLLLGAHRSLMILEFMSGEWDDSVAEFDTLVDLCDEIDDQSGSLIEPSGVRALIAVHRGDLAGAADLLRADLPAGFGWACWPDLARGLLADASGSPERALARLSETWDRCAREETYGDFSLIGPELVRLALSEGRPDRAEEVTAAVEKGAEANPDVATALASSLRCRGLVMADAEVLQEARAAYAKGGRVLDSAVACEEAAEMLGRAGQVSEARPLFEEAIAEYEGLGAAWDAGRAAARMRALGMRRGRRGSRQRPTTGWEALTPSELSVVVLVADGMSNPEVAERLFLSRRTVKAHVSGALTKLSMTSRVELAREATRRQLVRPGA